MKNSSRSFAYKVPISKTRGRASVVVNRFEDDTLWLMRAMMFISSLCVTGFVIVYSFVAAVIASVS